MSNFSKKKKRHTLISCHRCRYMWVSATTAAAAAISLTPEYTFVKLIYSRAESICLMCTNPRARSTIGLAFDLNSTFRANDPASTARYPPLFGINPNHIQICARQKGSGAFFLQRLSRFRYVYAKCARSDFVVKEMAMILSWWQLNNCARAKKRKL